MDEAYEMYERGVTTGVNAFNRDLVKDHILFTDSFPLQKQPIVFDPQTSGGLLAALPSNQGEAALKRLWESGVSDARIIGEVLEKSPPYDLIFS